MNQIHSLNKINNIIKEFKLKNERDPSYEEIENILNIPASKIDSILNLDIKTVSVDTPFKDDTEGTLIDVIPNNNAPKTDESLIKESLSIEINKILNKLPDRESDILRMYFGIQCKALTMEEIGKKFGITNERIRQIKEKAIKDLKDKHINYIKKLLNG
jgi:RNA polymerase primary sigma factor